MSADYVLSIYHELRARKYTRSEASLMIIGRLVEIERMYRDAATIDTIVKKLFHE